MANHHEAKAEGIESQLARSIFSDDEDATEKIEAKIARMEKRRDAMKEANKIVRRKPKNESTPEKVAELVALGMTESTARKLFEADFCGRFGFPSYSITNLGANIRRMRERIGDIGRQAARREAAAEAPEGVLIEGDEWVRVTFPEKPERDVINALKAAGFRWGAGSWCGQRENIPDCLRTELGMPRRGSLQWWATDRGFKCLIRCSRVYCWKSGERMARVTDVDNGRWMDHHDTSSEPWRWIKLTDNQVANFEAAARDCYCYQGVQRCDFCTSTRTPDGAPWSSGEDFAA